MSQLPDSACLRRMRLALCFNLVCALAMLSLLLTAALCRSCYCCSVEREASDYRFSRSFIQEGDEIMTKLRGAVHKQDGAGDAGDRQSGGSAGGGGGARASGDAKSSTCAVQ